MANGKTVERIGTGTIYPERGLIATTIFTRTLPTAVYRRVHWALPDARTDTCYETHTLEDQRIDSTNTTIIQTPGRPNQTARKLNRVTQKTYRKTPNVEQ